jgi:hypothetical protein
MKRDRVIGSSGDRVIGEVWISGHPITGSPDPPIWNVQRALGLVSYAKD